MRKLIIAVGLVGLAAGAATAAEFQPIGTLGMGGAGVARSMGPYASYWNPAGLAFADKTFAMTAGGGVGMRVSDGLANNVDRLSKFTEGGTNSTIEQLSNLTIAANAPAVGEMVNLLTVLKDMETQKGTLSLNVDAAVGFQYKNIGFGLFGIGEGFAQPLPSLVNILPSTGTTAITAPNLVTLAGTAASSSYFNATQISSMQTALAAAGIANATDQLNVINALGNSLATPTNANLPPITAAQATDTVVNVLAPALGSTGTIDTNKTAVMVKNVIFAEVPIAYGHAFDFGPLGKLGVGGAVKAVRGRVYQSRVQLIENGESVKSDDITSALKDNYEESTSVTFDLGAQYKFADWFTAGLVAKNLTSPKFKSPILKDHKGNLVDAQVLVLIATRTLPSSPRPALAWPLIRTAG